MILSRLKSVSKAAAAGPIGFVLLGALICTIAAPVFAAEKQKFPAPAVTDLLAGWNGLKWGEPLDAFKKRFAEAKQNEAGRWLTSQPESLAGVKVVVQYTFNKKGQFEMVTFVPDEAASKTFRKALVDAGVMRDAGNGNWSSQGVTFAIGKVGDDQVAVAINAKFKDPPEKK